MVTLLGLPRDMREDSAPRNSGILAVTSSPLGGVCVHAGLGMASRQVFGLAGYLLAPASQFMAEPVLIVGVFVPAYRCGAVPDSHRIPY